MFVLLRRLRSDGVAIIYVSHRLDEIMRIADRATIMRDGRRAVTARLSELSLATIIEHIIGRASRGLGAIERGGETRGPVLIELRNASGARKTRNVDLVIHQGEVLGATGLLGSGRSSLARLLFGMEPLVAGEILVKGVKVNISSPQDAIAAGVALIPEDRLLEGVIAQHSVGANIVLPVLERVSRYSWMSDAAAADDSRDESPADNDRLVTGRQPPRHTTPT